MPKDKKELISAGFNKNLGGSSFKAIADNLKGLITREKPPSPSLKKKIDEALAKKKRTK